MAKISTTQKYVDSLKFFMTPKDGGQIVEVRYACDEDGVWEWVLDRSDGESSYRFAAYNARATESQLAFEPQNGKIPRHNKWQQVTVREASVSSRASKTRIDQEASADA
jgi:hypothetical protein